MYISYNVDVLYVAEKLEALLYKVTYIPFSNNLLQSNQSLLLSSLLNVLRNKAVYRNNTKESQGQRGRQERSSAGRKVAPSDKSLLPLQIVPLGVSQGQKLKY